MDIQVVIRGYDQGTVHHLLETVREMGEPISLVQMRPMGILVPVALAIKAGLLELPVIVVKEPVPVPVPEPVKVAPRRGRPKKVVAVAEPQPQPESPPQPEPQLELEPEPEDALWEE